MCKRNYFLLHWIFLLLTVLFVSCQKDLSKDVEVGTAAKYDILEGASQVGGLFYAGVSGPSNTSNYLAFPVKVSKSGYYSIITKVPLVDGLSETLIEADDLDVSDYTDTIVFAGSGYISNFLGSIDSVYLYPTNLSTSMPSGSYYVKGWPFYNLNKYDSTDLSTLIDTTNFSFQIGAMDAWTFQDNETDIVYSGVFSSKAWASDDSYISLTSTAGAELTVTLPYSSLSSIAVGDVFDPKVNAGFSMTLKYASALYTTTSSTTDTYGTGTLKVLSYNATTRVLTCTFSGELELNTDATSTYSISNGTMIVQLPTQ